MQQEITIAGIAITFSPRSGHVLFTQDAERRSVVQPGKPFGSREKLICSGSNAIR